MPSVPRPVGPPVTLGQLVVLPREQVLPSDREREARKSSSQFMSYHCHAARQTRKTPVPENRHTIKRKVRKQIIHLNAKMMISFGVKSLRQVKFMLRPSSDRQCRDDRQPRRGHEHKA